MDEQYDQSSIVDSSVPDQLSVDDLTFPSYMPIDKHMMREFESATKVSNQINIDEMIKETIKSCYNLVEFIFKNEIMDINTAALEANCETLRELYSSKYQGDLLKQIIQNCKEEVMQTRRSDDVLSMETWKSFNDVEKLQFGDYFEQELSKIDINLFESWLKKNKDYQTIRYLPKILKHPEEPIPEDNDDDDLNIAGGKVSLKDPITLRIFTNPVISKCGHTYERDSIFQQMSGNTTTCAISGCETQIERKDLKEDKIMSIRVQAFTHHQKFVKDDKYIPVLLS